MQLILLVTPDMMPIPDDVKVVQEFGSEHIFVNDDPENRVSGISYFVEAPKEAIVKWLKPFAGVWISNNPMAGQWRVVHIKEELING